MCGVQKYSMVIIRLHARMPIIYTYSFADTNIRMAQNMIASQTDVFPMCIVM